MSERENDKREIGEFDGLVERISSSYANVSYVGESPRLEATPARTPSRFQRPQIFFKAGSFALAASVLAALAITFVLPTGNSTAWAAEPKRVSRGEAFAIRAACIERYPADQGAESEGSLAMPKLGEADAIDYRGDKALSVYTDEGFKAICVTQLLHGKWRMISLSTEVGATAGPAGLVAESGISLANGEQIVYASGSIEAGCTSATLKLKDGTVFTPTIYGNTFVAWYPTGSQLEHDSLKCDSGNGLSE